MSIKAIVSEVTVYIAKKIDAKEIVNLDLVVHEITASKPGVEGPDADFYIRLANKELREIVKSCVAKYNNKDGASRQISLPGFEYLQVAYPVRRNGDSLLVTIERMTHDEIDNRADEYEAMGRGCLTHASELRGYNAARKAANDNNPATDKVAA